MGNGARGELAKMARVWSGLIGLPGYLGGREKETGVADRVALGEGEGVPDYVDCFGG